MYVDPFSLSSLALVSGNTPGPLCPPVSQRRGKPDFHLVSVF
jgi:hypothetical protein